MKIRFNIFCLLLFLILIFTFVFSGESQAVSWKEEKGKHFIVRYPSHQKVGWARNVIDKAEIYYEKVAKDIGYSRYRNFWTWDNRVVITIYPDKDSFIEGTGQPQWSRGGAVRHNNLSSTKSIISYIQEGEFIEEILPHEISHLILWDFIGFEKVIPMWFEEGVAQLQEIEKAGLANRAMKRLVLEEQHVPFSTLFYVDIRKEKDSLKVTIFYLESYSVVKFLIDQYGSDNFGRLCRGLRDGKGFEKALKEAYVLKISDFSDLEKKWLSYMKKH